MTTYTPEALSRAITAVCSDIRSRAMSDIIFDERQLWWELSCCILSSQVPYPLAIAAADRISESGTLLCQNRSEEELTDLLYKLLSKTFLVDGNERKYRFPKAKAEQLASTYKQVYSESKTLQSLIGSFSDVNIARQWFVDKAPGFGPKQASMFLRNCGFTYDLAILDRHVLNYMSLIGIYNGRHLSISGMNQYGRHEKALKKHAQELNCPVGLLDWAIWIVMRVAARNPKEIIV